MVWGRICANLSGPCSIADGPGPLLSSCGFGRLLVVGAFEQPASKHCFSRSLPAQSPGQGGPWLLLETLLACLVRGTAGPGPCLLNASGTYLLLLCGSPGPSFFRLGCHPPQQGAGFFLYAAHSPGPFSALKIGQIAHAICALAFVSFYHGRTGFTLYPVCNSMRPVPAFFGEPGLHLCNVFSYSVPARGCCASSSRGRASSTINPALRLRPRRGGAAKPAALARKLAS